MIKAGEFEKVSLEQFIKDMHNCFSNLYSDNDIKDIYDNIQLPTRSTTGSAGYDFYIPFDITMDKDKVYQIPTGIRCKMFNEWFLMVCPRSGLGCKHGFRLENTVGIIDSDYYGSDNEGHIMLFASQHRRDTLDIKQGAAFVQGIFIEYGITRDDNTYDVRNGGFGSTD